MADSEIFAFSTFDTGQPDLVCSAISVNFASSDVRHFRDADEIAVRDREAVTDLLEPHRGLGLDGIGGEPALPRPADNAIVKHAACAAPMSSSGLVPGPSSKRALKPYGAS